MMLRLRVSLGRCCRCGVGRLAARAALVAGLWPSASFPTSALLAQQTSPPVSWDAWQQNLTSPVPADHSGSSVTGGRPLSISLKRPVPVDDVSAEAAQELGDLVRAMSVSHRQPPGPVPSVPGLESGPAPAPFDFMPAEPGGAGIWWGPVVQSPLRQGTTPVRITLEQLLVQALDHSSQIKVFSDLPMIRQTAIVEADAAFDPAAFLDSRWDDQNDPVGNVLTTGGPSRYKNSQLSAAAGLRQRTRTGGQVEVSERVGYQDTNSVYFVPNPQGTSKLVLNFTQPLLRGNGCEYNQSLIVLAQIDKGVAEDEFSRQLQAHLLEVTRSYWGLYLERALLTQKRRSLSRAEHVHQLLQDRVEIDAIRPQILRAEAEVATRRSELIRAELAVQNAEARIRALVNNPALGDSESTVELIPLDTPVETPAHVDLSNSLTTALQTRPEVNQAIKQIRAGCVRQQISKNELMPSLNLITEAYVAGLQGDGSIGDAFTDQFHVGGPSYTVGMQFEVPLHNRAAKSRHERRRVELRQLQNQYQTTIHTLGLEVEVAVRELETSFSEMQSQKRAVDASTAQLDYLQKRWELLPGEDGTGALVLDNLLTAQERVVLAENAHTQAWVTYNLAIMNHQRATGELLQAQDISWGDYLEECDGISRRLLHKPLTSDDATSLSTPDQTPGPSPDQTPEQRP